MKKFINIALYYAVFGMVAGIFYREFTKYINFSGDTVLGKVHPHILTMGTLFYLIVSIFVVITNIETLKIFSRAVVLHNIGLIFTVIMMLVRGVFEVLDTELSSGANASISGISGIAHMLLGTGIILFFIALKKADVVGKQSE